MIISLKSILKLLYIFFFYFCACFADDPIYGWCADPQCSSAISKAITLTNYPAGDRSRISFKQGEEAIIFVKDAGPKNDLYGVMIQDRSGYVPKSMIKEMQMFVSSSQLVRGIWSLAPPFLQGHYDGVQFNSQNQWPAQQHFPGSLGSDNTHMTSNIQPSSASNEPFLDHQVQPNMPDTMHSINPNTENINPQVYSSNEIPQSTHQHFSPEVHHISPDSLGLHLQPSHQSEYHGSYKPSQHINSHQHQILSQYISPQHQNPSQYISPQHQNPSQYIDGPQNQNPSQYNSPQFSESLNPSQHINSPGFAMPYDSTQQISRSEYPVEDQYPQHQTPSAASPPSSAVNSQEMLPTTSFLPSQADPSDAAFLADTMKYLKEQGYDEHGDVLPASDIVQFNSLNSYLSPSEHRAVGNRASDAPQSSNLDAYRHNSEDTSFESERNLIDMHSSNVPPALPNTHNHQNNFQNHAYQSQIPQNQGQNFQLPNGQQIPVQPEMQFYQNQQAVQAQQNLNLDDTVHGVVQNDPSGTSYELHTSIPTNIHATSPEFGSQESVASQSLSNTFNSPESENQQSHLSNSVTQNTEDISPSKSLVSEDIETKYADQQINDLPDYPAGDQAPSSGISARDENEHTSNNNMLPSAGFASNQEIAEESNASNDAAQSPNQGIAEESNASNDVAQIQITGDVVQTKDKTAYNSNTKAYYDEHSTDSINDPVLDTEVEGEQFNASGDINNSVEKESLGASNDSKLQENSAVNQNEDLFNKNNESDSDVISKDDSGGTTDIKTKNVTLDLDDQSNNKTLNDFTKEIMIQEENDGINENVPNSEIGNATEIEDADFQELLNEVNAETEIADKENSNERSAQFATDNLANKTDFDFAGVDTVALLQTRHLTAEDNQMNETSENLDENSSNENYEAYNVFENSLQVLRSLCDAVLSWLPEPLYSVLMELQEKGISPRVPVFTAVTSIPCLLLVVAIVCIKEKSKEKRLTAVLTKVEKNVYDLTALNRALEDKLQNAEVELQASKVSLIEERNSFEDSKVEKYNLNEHLEKINLQLENKNSEIESLKERDAEFTELITDHEKAHFEILEQKKELERQMSDQDETIQRMSDQLQEKEELHQKLQSEIDEYLQTNQSNEEKLSQFQQNCNQLLQEAEVWNIRMNELTTKLNEEISIKDELENSLKEKESRVESLELIVDRYKCVEETDSDDLEDTTTKEQKLQQLIDSASTLVKLQKKEEENRFLSEKLQEEKNTILNMEVELLEERSENDKMKICYNQALQDKTEAQTKLEVLTNYFKDKEIQLQKQLGVQEAFCQQRKEDASHAERQITLIEQENTSYKAQVASMKQEVEETERNLKNQIAAQEKKAHENWIAARNAERKVEDMKQELTLLRQRLTLLEREQENSLNYARDDIIRPVPKKASALNDDSSHSLDFNNSMDARGNIFPDGIPPPHMMLPSDRPLPPPLFPPPFMPLDGPPPFRPLPPWHMPPSADFRRTPPDFRRGEPTATRGRHGTVDSEAGPRQSSPLSSDLRDSRNSSPPHSLLMFHDIPPPPRPFFPPPPPHARYPMHPPYRMPPPHQRRSDNQTNSNVSRSPPSTTSQDSWSNSQSRV